MLNKILKSVIGLVLLSFLVFLVLGIPNTQHEMITEIEINAPVEEVYNYVMDIDNNENWLSGFVSADLIKGEKGAVGSEYKVVFLQKGKPMEMKETITDVVPNQKIGFDLSDKMIDGHIDIEFKATGSGTQVKEIHGFHGKSILSRAITKMFSKAIHKGKQEMYDDLKKVIEGN
ncbi:MAG: SRPBCC family protein [Bacteroidetes bacterium]|nr:SRPBCC family protein [Bacteroidota bacterium]